MPEKILVVDDEISLQETVAYNLKKQGYDVQTTGDGAEALELARELQPDLVYFGCDAARVGRLRDLPDPAP